MPLTRTFIAVPAAPQTRAAATRLISRLRPTAGDVRWTPADNLHWTLQFLGDVEDLEIPALCAAVAAAAAQIEPFELEARGAGAFPAADRPRTLWIGARQGRQEMQELQAAIENRLAELGYRGEGRRYVPHLTLGRVGRGADLRSLAAELTALADLDAGTMLVDEVIIFASQLTRQGSIHEPLAHAPLAQ
jgi:RNA 2',3'-cyclic 3'-phosphodiesterase